MKPRWTVLAAAVALLALAGCGADEPAAGPEPTGDPGATGEPTGEPTATEEPTDDMDDHPEATQSLTGTLGGDAELEGGCAWLETRDGVRHEVLWPDGYAVGLAPLELTGPGGDTLARAGDEVTVTGRPADDMASICMVGPIFEAHEVEISS